MLRIGRIGGVLAAAAVAAAPAMAAAPSDMEGRWKSDIRDVIILDIVTCGNGYCGQVVLPSGCGETVLRLVETKALGDGWEMEGTMAAPAEKHVYKAYGFFEIVSAEEGGPRIHVDGYDELPSYDHREFPFGASFYRIGPASCRTAPAS